MPRGGGRGRAVAPDLVEDARSAVTAAAAQTLQSKTLLLEVEAVGMGLRFVEIEAAQQVGIRGIRLPWRAIQWSVRGMAAWSASRKAQLQFGSLGFCCCMRLTCWTQSNLQPF